MDAGERFERYSDNFDASLMAADKSQTVALYAGSQIPSQPAIYRIIYENIRDCNLIIDEFDEGSESSTEILGLAYAIRGISYYMLLKQFCDAYNPADDGQLGLPLIKEFDMEARVNRSTYKETVLFIETDLKKSLNYRIENTDLLFTPDVVKAFLSRLYFWTQNWKEAITYSSEIIKGHPLVDRNGFKEMMSATEIKGNIILRTGFIYDRS